MTSSPRAIFVGTGHAHLYALKRASDFTRRGFEVMAISPENFWYSGLATGVLGGHYQPDQDQVSIENLLKWAGPKAFFLRDRVLAINPTERSVRVAGGATYHYDVLSLNLGSEAKALPGTTERVFPIKPLRKLWELHQALKAAQGRGQRPRVVIAGGGASGCEIAANVRALLRVESEVTVLAHGPQIAPTFPPGARDVLHRWLISQGIRVCCDSPVRQIEERFAITAGGERHAFDFLVNATGLQPPTLLAESNLPLGESGGMLVNDYLQSTGASEIFGGGDCVQMRGRELARIGVYAVREAPVLYENVLATLEARPLRVFKPQKHFLLILNLGGGMGLACWRNFHWLGRTAFWVKDRIDRAFINHYQKAH